MKKLLILFICTGCTLTISIQPVKKQVKQDVIYGTFLPGNITTPFQNGLTPTPSFLFDSCFTCLKGTLHIDSSANWYFNNPNITLCDQWGIRNDSTWIIVKGDTMWMMESGYFDNNGKKLSD